LINKTTITSLHISVKGAIFCLKFGTI
jgi:hypothetical protein